MTRFAFVDREKALYDVTVLCSLLKVSRSGFYAWLRRPPSARAIADQVLTEQIRDAFDDNRQVYEQPAAPAGVDGAEAGLSFVSSKSLGGAWALDGLWRRLGLDELVHSALRGWRCDPVAVERVLFALVANRALEACSKLAAGRWVERDAHVPGLAVLDEDAAYRAMDLLLEVESTLAEQVFWATATLLDLEVDLVFFDTSSTYFERDTADDPVGRDDRGEPVADPDQGVGEPVGFGTYGHSKDSRDDLPQVVIGMAVTRTGIPIRTWCWPGNTADMTVMGQVRADLRDWKLTRVVWVTDRGFASAANRRGVRELVRRWERLYLRNKPGSALQTLVKEGLVEYIPTPHRPVPSQQRSAAMGMLSVVAGALAAHREPMATGAWRASYAPQVQFPGGRDWCPALNSWGPNTRAVLAPAVLALHAHEDALQAQAGAPARARIAIGAVSPTSARIGYAAPATIADRLRG